MIRTCEVCRIEYRVYGKLAPRSRWCSRACRAVYERGPLSPKWKGGRAATLERMAIRNAAIRNAAPAPRSRPLAGANRFCKKCGEPFVKKGRSYHVECRPKMIEVACVDCGAVRRTSVDRPYQRCWSCSMRRHGGALNPRWRGGITPENQKIRASKAYAVWRWVVFERDNYTCVHCGQRGGELHADHIKPFATHPDLRLVIENGRTLCFACHSKTPTFLGGAARLARRMRRERTLTAGGTEVQA
jgi:5-methylcytosine-specific restriction endonuclease McrA